ncbi:MAG TPA: alpha/beta fold hydrolase [Pseudolysinimonas sp.]|nr:alpha/beta fold hydrolase [Pseudolysinimonas sp.]
MTTFILVHGGSHTSSCWEPVIAPLESHGHRVRAIDLPGRFDTDTPVTLDDWVNRLGAEVDDALASDGEPPVLVGHSMGGVTISQLAERRPQDVAELVYVNAVVPNDGESALESLGAAAGESVVLEEGSLVPGDEKGQTLAFVPGIGRRAFYNMSSTEDAIAAEAQMVPEHVVPMASPVQLGSAFASVPKRWIASTEDRTVPMTLQKTYAARVGAPLTTIHADHSPFMSATTEFVGLLEEA